MLIEMDVKDEETRKLQNTSKWKYLLQLKRNYAELLAHKASNDVQ